MKPPDKVEDVLRQRQVSFEENTMFSERAPKPMTLLHDAAKSRLNHHRAKVTVFQNLFDGKTDVLDGYFKPYSQEELADFYMEKGTSIFRMALLSPLTAAPLEYLIKSVPRVVACEILSRGNFSILAGFIGGKKVQEDEGFFAQDMQQAFNEKLELIYSLRDEGINNYIRANADYKHLLSRGLKPVLGL